MSEVRSELRYLASHEWARKDEDGSIVVGISDHAQDALGDVVFVELPEVGASVDAEAEVAVVESVKACLLYTSPSPRDRQKSRMPSSA